MTRFTFLTVAGLFLLAIHPAWSSEPTPAATGVVNPTVTSPSSYASVLVLPFAPVSGASEWIGKGIQEDLATELVQQSRLDVRTPEGLSAVSDPVAAAKIGRDSGASLVVFGSYQIEDTDVRINGQLVDTATGKALVGLKATGPRRDLFHMEDLLAAQAVNALPPGSIKVPGGAYAPTPAAGATAPVPGVSGSYSAEPYNAEGYYVTSAPAPAPSYDYVAASVPPTSTYDSGYSNYTEPYPYGYADYGYPYYNYGYPFFGGGFFYIGGFGNHHHDHDHDHDGYRGGESSHGFSSRGQTFNNFGGDRANGFAGQSNRSIGRAFGDAGLSAHAAPTFHSSIGNQGGFGGGSHFFGAAGGGFHGGGGGGGHR